MNYYIYEDESGEIVGWIQTNKVLPPPAKLVTKAFFIEHDLYVPEPDPPEPEPDATEAIWAEMAAAYREGVQSA